MSSKNAAAVDGSWTRLTLHGNGFHHIAIKGSFEELRRLTNACEDDLRERANDPRCDSMMILLYRGLLLNTNIISGDATFWFHYQERAIEFQAMQVIAN